MAYYFEEIKKSANWGFIHAQYLLGLLYYHGKETRKDLKQALYWLGKAAASGDLKHKYDFGKACLKVADMIKNMPYLANGVLNEDPQTLMALGQNLIQETTDQGYNAEAITHYDSIIPIAKTQTGFDLIENLAQEGDVEAQAILGASYFAGAEDWFQDTDKAFIWLKKAADSGDPAMIYILGSYYLKTTLMLRDAPYLAGKLASKTEHELYEKAFNFIKNSADQGYAPAINKLALFYFEGLCGLKQNFNIAAEYFIRAAELKQPEALFYIGFMYAYGVGLTKNPAKALVWLTVAASTGLPQFNAKAFKIIKSLKHQITPTDEQKTYEFARQWLFNPSDALSDLYNSEPKAIKKANAVYHSIENLRGKTITIDNYKDPDNLFYKIMHFIGILFLMRLIRN